MVQQSKNTPKRNRYFGKSEHKTRETSTRETSTREFSSNCVHLKIMMTSVPGVKDFIAVVELDGYKKKIQKRLILFNPKEAHRLFKEIFLNMKISLCVCVQFTKMSS